MGIPENYGNFDFMNCGDFPIGGWAEPLPPEFTEGKSVVTAENYRKIRECGFDFVCSIYALFPRDKELVLKHLSAAGENGVKVYVSDATVRAKELDVAAAKEGYKILKKEKGFGGYLVKDEPGSNEFAAIKVKDAAMKENLAGAGRYYNLLPTYSTGFMLKNGYWSNEAPILQCDINEYNEYVRSFIETVKPEFLSYDFYPFTADGSILPDYFVQLSIAARNAAEYYIPFMPFVQVCKFNTSSRKPTAEEIKWQINTQIAYGARGMQFFTLWSPVNSQYENFSGCIFGTFGETGERYYEMKGMISFAKRVGGELKNYSLVGVLPVGQCKLSVPEEDIVTESGAEFCGNVFVGVFKNKKGEKAYFAVCNDVKVQTEFGIKINDGSVMQIVGEKGAEKVGNGEYRAVLKAGEGLLIKLKK